MQRIRSVESESEGLQAGAFLCSFDVVSLYTYVPSKGAVDNLVDFLSNVDGFSLSELNSNDVRELLTVILTNTYFEFYGKVFKQISGLAMGSSVSPVLAVLYLHSIESRTLSSFNLTLYARYIDDCFLICSQQEVAASLLDAFNQADPNIKFESEHPRADGSISLLDFNVRIENSRASFDYYQKKARSDVFVNYHSAIPMQQKLSVIHNERKRIEDRCSSAQAAVDHIRAFEDRLRRNDYPERVVLQTRQHARRRNHTMRAGSSQHNRPIEATGNDSNMLVFRMPFLDDRTFYRIKNVFKRYDLPVRVVTQSNTLRSVLRVPRRNTQMCTLQGCTVKPHGLCFKKNVVYQLVCTGCHAAYIGSTIRPLHSRIAEHFSKNNSAVCQHIIACPSDLNLSILTNGSDATDLRLKEALLIKQNRPSLNRRDELVEVEILTAGIQLPHKPIHKQAGQLRQSLLKVCDVVALSNNEGSSRCARPTAQQSQEISSGMMEGNRRVTRSMAALTNVNK